MIIDKEYIVGIRRLIHEYPEIGFDLPRTTALVKGELDKMGIPYTEKYAPGSVVGYINPEKTDFTIGLLGAEDFSRYLQRKPGVFMRIGTRNVEKGITTLAHNNDFMIDEDVLGHGSATMVQFVLNQMELRGKSVILNKM